MLFEAELEDMCEEEPTTWEDIVEGELWGDNHTLGGTCDSVTREAMDPKKVQEGCDEEMGLMEKCMCGTG